MYTEITYQDWIETLDRDKPRKLLDIIRGYKTSEDFQHALTAQAYFESRNESISAKVIMKPVTVNTSEEINGNTRNRKSVVMDEIVGARVYSNFFFRFVVQQCQFLLGSGVTIGGDESDQDEDLEEGNNLKEKLGIGFDTLLQQIGEKALIHGTCWGYWNLDHVEVIEAAKDARSGFVALVDELDGANRIGIQFWQLSDRKPLWIRLFEIDGISLYKVDHTEDKNANVILVEPKQPYMRKLYTDAAGSYELDSSNYPALPVVPMYANPERRSELTNALRSKIDAYDRISSDFVDNLDRANEIYWVLNNFGGTREDIAEIVAEFERLRMIVNQSDGMGGGSTAAPHNFQVPYEARRVALELLKDEICRDFMGLSLEEITGGSLTNVAIRAAETNLNLKCDRFEWQVFKFVQDMLKLQGVETEQINFTRRGMTNYSETVSDIALMDYVDTETKLRINPYINQEDILGILERLAAENYTGKPLNAPGKKDTVEIVEDEERSTDEEDGFDRETDGFDREADAPIDR